MLNCYSWCLIGINGQFGEDKSEEIGYRSVSWKRQQKVEREREGLKVIAGSSKFVYYLFYLSYKKKSVNTSYIINLLNHAGAISIFFLKDLYSQGTLFELRYSLGFF